MSDKIIPAIINAVDTVSALRRGDYVAAAAHAADLVLDIVPGDDAKRVLDAAIFRRVQREGALAEQLKFPDE